MVGVSAETKALISEWSRNWSARAAEALLPVANLAVGDEGFTAIAELQDALQTRGKKKAGLDM